MNFGPQKGHVAFIFENFFNDFGLLVLAIVIGLIRGDMSMIAENAGVLVIVLLGPVTKIIAYLHTFYSVDEEKLTIRSGWIKKQVLEVPISTITTVDFSQNIFHQIFGVYKLNIDNTSNMTSGETKVHMTLSKSDADLVRSLLIKGRDGLDGANYAAEQSQLCSIESNENEACEEVLETIEISAKNTSQNHKFVMKNKDLLLMGLLKSKGLFMIEVVGVVAVICSFAPISEEQIVDQAVRLVDFFGLGAVILIGCIGLFILAALGGMVLSLIRYYGFKVLDNGEAVKIEYGLLNRKTYTMPKKKISGFYFEQSALMRLAKVGTLNLMAVGYGAGSDENSSEESILFPLMKEKDVHQAISSILPEMQHGEEYQKPERKALRYFFVRFSIFFSIGFLGGCIYLPKVSEFFEGMWIVGAVLLLMALVGAVLSYRCTAIYGNQSHFSLISGGFKKMTVFVKTNMIESIASNGSVWKRRHGIADIEIGCLAPMGFSSQGVDNMPSAVVETLKEHIIY